jgi:hypothetical protein
MDIGIGINLIYAKTLRAMHISLELLKPIECLFHGIIPGSANYPLGQIALDICFGNRLNYRREKLEFEVMDWSSQYHKIHERPTYSRFMVVPHYTYLVVKTPGPNGIITVKGSFDLYDIFDKEFHKMAQSFGAIAEYGESKGRAEHSTSSTPTCPSPEVTIDDTPKAKKLWVHTKDPNNSTPNESGTPNA